MYPFRRRKNQEVTRKKLYLRYFHVFCQHIGMHCVVQYCMVRRDEVWLVRYIMIQKDTKRYRTFDTSLPLALSFFPVRVSALINSTSVILCITIFGLFRSREGRREKRRTGRGWRPYNRSRSGRTTSHSESIEWFVEDKAVLRWLSGGYKEMSSILADQSGTMILTSWLCKPFDGCKIKF